MRAMKTFPSTVLSAVSAAVALAFLPVPAAAQTHEPLRLSLQLVAEGLVSPLSVVTLPDGRGLVADQVGVVRVLKSGGVGPISPARSRSPSATGGAARSCRQ